MLAHNLVGCLALIEQSSQVRTEFAADSLLEGGGFEPSVPRKRDSVFRCAPDRTPREILPAARLARRQSVLWSNHILSVKSRRLWPTRILSAYKKRKRSPVSLPRPRRQVTRSRSSTASLPRAGRTSPSRSGLSACSRGQWARAARRSRWTANSSAGTPNRAGRDRPRRYASARSALARRPSANGSALAEGPAGDRARQSPLYSE
jgi:hypothetical protein